MSNQKSKNIIYETLKALGRSTKTTPLNESSSTDFFAQEYEQEGDIYLSESFLKFFGDSFVEEDIEEAIKRVQTEIEIAKQKSDDSSSSSGSEDEERVEKIEVKKFLNVLRKMIKRS
ncbi:4414_t:CDS:1 [Ambispora gerdemannii]|uniref:4414_t:CDS:1 n=1 Tax=Ambispora gerdemannii TaxID=144530 RepID=A0A9N8YP85_9GLOM|nr:4414_t:CDS:1 [Ambispora gerdemannii]